MRAIHPIVDKVTNEQLSDGWLHVCGCVEIMTNITLALLHGVLSVSHQASGCRQWTNQRIRNELDARDDCLCLYYEWLFVCV